MAKEFNWTDRELANLPVAHQAKVCGLNPKWGRCAHPQCQRLWKLTPETASPRERGAIWPLLAGAEIVVEVASAPAKAPQPSPLFG